MESPKKIDVCAIVADAEPEVSEITLNQIPEAQLFKTVIVEVKVVRVREATKPIEKMKQDVVLVDNSGTVTPL